MHLLRCEILLVKLQIGFSFVWCYHLPIIHEGLKVIPRVNWSFRSFFGFANRDVNLCWLETQLRTHFLGDAMQSLPFLLLDIESKVIKEECTEESMVFNLKTKGNEMKIGCSTIKESESTGIDSLVRIKKGDLGAFNQHILIDHLLGTKTHAR